MSGLEVIAGLVLGGIPIAISALHGINTTQRTIKRFKKWRLQLPQYVSRLKEEEASLVLTLELLLRSIGMDGLDVKLICRDSDHKVWKDPQIVQKLRARHGKAYDSIEEDIFEIRKNVEDLIRCLGAEPPSSILFPEVEGQPPKATEASISERFHDFRNRVRYSTSRDTIKDLLDSIRNTQQAIDQLFGKSEQVAKSNALQRAEGNLRIRSLHRHASLLHSVLSKVLRCTQHVHDVRLQLEEHPWEADRNVATGSDSRIVSFGLCLSSTTPDTWCYAEIRVSEAKQSSSVASSTSPTIVQDLCSSICTSCTEGQHQMDLRIDPEHGDALHKESQHNQSDNRPWTTVGPFTFTSLQTVLPREMNRNSTAIKLTEADRKWLAVTVTANMLLLQSTPWMENARGKGDILLAHEADSSSETLQNSKYPFVSCRFSGESANLSPSNAGAGAIGSHSRKARETLLMLAIFLMEMWCGEPFESYQNDSGPSNDLMSTFCILQKWREQKRYDLSNKYHQALEYCIMGYLHLGFDFDRDKWVDAAIHNVIVPLNNEYKDYVGMKGCP